MHTLKYSVIEEKFYIALSFILSSLTAFCRAFGNFDGLLMEKERTIKRFGAWLISAALLQFVLLYSHFAVVPHTLSPVDGSLVHVPIVRVNREPVKHHTEGVAKEFKQNHRQSECPCALFTRFVAHLSVLPEPKASFYDAAEQVIAVNLHTTAKNSIALLHVAPKHSPDVYL